MKVLLIIPAYNEEKNIERVVDHLIDCFPQYDYLVVNDGSKDNTEAICENRGYHLLSLPVNLGLAGAFQAGLKYADRQGYDYALQFDADGQHLPECIAPMLEEAQKGYDIVVGSRFVTKKKPFTLRMVGSHLISFAMRLTTGKRVKDPTSGMRMFGKRLNLRYTLLWLLSAFVLLILAILPGIITEVAHLVGIASPVNTVFVLEGLFVLFILLSLTSIVSGLNRKIYSLTQYEALLEGRVRELEKKLNLEGKEQVLPLDKTAGKDYTDKVSQ